ncbi:MAG: DUF2508 family protein [Ruminococcaceae bacterium]|nr:DUF2508 family protein [Oscillospiraceae bacterium]
MLNMLNILKKKRTRSDREREEILSELERISDMLKKNETLFNIAEDEKMVEAVIYEQMSLQSRYIYMLNQAREKGVKIDYIDRLK